MTQNSRLYSIEFHDCQNSNKFLHFLHLLTPEGSFHVVRRNIITNNIIIINIVINNK